MSDDASLDGPDDDEAADSAEPRGPRARWRSATAWGAVGALAVLVSHQGYVLLGGDGVGLPVALAVAAVVFAVVAPLSYLAEGALAARNERA